VWAEKFEARGALRSAAIGASGVGFALTRDRRDAFARKLVDEI